MSKTRLLALALLMALVAALTTSCTSKAEVLTIYSGRTEELIAPLLATFAEENGVDIEVRYGQSSDLALQIGEEGDKSPADVFISQTPGPVAYLDSKDLLASIDTEVLDLVPASAHAADGSWVGLSARKRVLVYNSDLVDPADLPDSVMDLTDPEWKGMVGLAPSNGSFQDFITIMRHRLGDEATVAWLEGMEANDSPTYDNNNAIVEAVGRGEIPMGLVNHYYNYRALAEDPDAPSLNYDFPPDDLGSSVIVTAATVLESSENKALAEELVAFLLSEESQQYFADETFEYPLAAGVEPPAELPEIDLAQIESIDFDTLGGDLQSTLAMIDESGLNS